MTIQAVLFDIGGVLFHLEDLTVHRQWERRLGLSEGQLFQLIFGNPVAQRATVGKATEEEIWNHVGNQLGLAPEELAALRADIWRGSVWDTELLAFIGSLRPPYRTGTISNSWPGAPEGVREYVNTSLFDVSVFSAEEGVQKPHPEIYRRALMRLGVAPQEAVFVDDMPPNVEGARRIGMQGIHFTDSMRAREEIEEILRSEGLCARGA